MLYIYDDNLFQKLRADFPKEKMVTLAELCMKFQDLIDLEEISEDSNYEETQIIEISNFIKFSTNDAFLESYIIKLKEKLPGVNFAIQVTLAEEFKKRFPLLFDEEEYLYGYVQEQIEENELPTSIFPIVASLDYYLTKQNQGELFVKEQICSLAFLMEAPNIYNISTILEQLEITNIKYLDISTLIDKLKDQPNIIFDFQSFLYSLIKGLSEKADIKFIVSEKLLSDTMIMFPNIFQKEHCIVGEAADEVFPLSEIERSEEIDEDLDRLVDTITNKLLGHTTFKENFKRDFLNFKILNKISERKIFSILITGESGIGKTEFAKIVSKVLYPDEKLIKINFGNYSTEGVLNSLIGSPLGYSGSEEGGELIAKITHSKSKVILIDEFEKATIGIFNFFYELLEDGKFTDRKGVEHDLDGYIIIFTSNMTEKLYSEIIPGSLRSRFDMISRFVGIKESQKVAYIDYISRDLSHKLQNKLNITIDLESPALKSELYALVDLENLRQIKRKVQSIITEEYQKKVLR